MKRFLLCISLLGLSLCALGWGRLGHSTIAEIAQRHLTPSARANIEYYTHGTPLAEYASWMDEVAATPPFDKEFAGWHASVATPDCQSPLYVRKAARGCRDGVTAMEFFREYLKDFRQMPDSVVLQAIKCMVHIVGDFHCPAHVRYTDERNELKYKVSLLGREGTLHAVWDSGIIQLASGLDYRGWREYADRLDTWDEAAIASVTEGWAREWFEDCARDVRPYIRTVPEGAELDRGFVDAHIGLAELELRKASYQLAKALNTIFSDPLIESGIWFLDKRTAVERSGLKEGDAIEFAVPVDRLPKGTWVEFGVSLECKGDKAPLHYMVEYYDGGQWVSDPSRIYNDGLSDCSFYTVTSSVRHPSVYLGTYCLRNEVRDTLKARCRVCSSYAVDRTPLDASADGNKVYLRHKKSMGAFLKPLGTVRPSRTKEVLLIGNSFTYYYGEPFILEEIAMSQGLRLNLSISLKGGQSYRQHCGLDLTRYNCTRGRYDYAFIQGQSQEPAQLAADPAGKKDVCDAYCELCSLIRSVSPRARIYVENTWGYPGASNGGFASLEEFDRLLDEGTTMLAAAAGSRKSLVGQAFTASRERYQLLDTDTKHPGLAGAYLKACVVYLTISGKAFRGDVPCCGLPEEEAAYLRAQAEKVVLGR